MEELIEKLKKKHEELATGIKFRKTSRYNIGQHDILTEILKDIEKLGPSDEVVEPKAVDPKEVNSEEEE